MTSKILRADGVTYLSGIKTVTFHETVNADVNLRPGCVSSSYIEVVCFGAQSSAPSAGEALTYYQTVNGTDTLIGVFYAQPSIPTKNSYRFVAYDAISKLDSDFSAWLSANQANFPYTVYQLVSQACSIAGVTLGSSSWSLSTESINAFYADGITCRDILQYAAEIGCKFVTCHSDGNVYFDWYTSTTNKRIYPSSGTSGSETRYAYKQDGLTYANYDTTAVARVAVHPVGEDDVAYYYPTNVQSGNTLEITNNAFLYGATSTLMSTVAQTIYSAMTSLGTYRPFEANLFPNENPFRAGQTVPVTDAQGVSFNTIIMSMTVSGSEARVESTGNEVYTEYALDTAKKLIQLAADIVQINKLKVDWAEINQIFAEDITVTGKLHSSDYSYTTGNIYSNAGIGIDFQSKIMNTPSFAITSGGDLYARNGRIAGFNIARNISQVYYANNPPFYDTSGAQSSNYTFDSSIYEITVGENGTVRYQPIRKSYVVSGETAMLSMMWIRCTYGGHADEEWDAPVVTVSYLDQNDTVIHSDTWYSVIYYPSGGNIGSMLIVDQTYLASADKIRFDVTLTEGDTCQVSYYYGVSASLYYGVNGLGRANDSIYLGTDGISVGKNIVLTPNGTAVIEDIALLNPALEATKNDTRLMRSKDIYSELQKGFYFGNIGTVIPNNADLNNYTTVGNYRGSSAYTYSNAPKSGVAFTLRVLKPTGSISSTWVCQIFIVGNPGQTDTELVYIRYGASSWHSWKRIPISSELDSYVLKAGDTMSGNLTMDNYGVIAKSTSFEDGTVQSPSAVGDARYYMHDKNGYNLGYVAPYFNADGRQAIGIVSRRKITGGSNLANALYLYIASDGTRSVAVSEAKPWRQALELGTNGTLPITIDQGGTGQIALVTETVVANVASAEPDCTITGVTYNQWGKLASLYITIKKTTAVTTNTTTTLATIVSGKRPANRSIAMCLTHSNPAKANINTAGVIAVTGTISAGQEMGISCTYILP